MPIEGIIGGGSGRSTHVTSLSGGPALGTPIKVTYSLVYFEQGADRFFGRRVYGLRMLADLHLGDGPMHVSEFHADALNKVQAACMEHLDSEKRWWRRTPYRIERRFGLITFSKKSYAVAIRLAVDL